MVMAVVVVVLVGGGGGGGDGDGDVGVVVGVTIHSYGGFSSDEEEIKLWIKMVILLTTKFPFFSFPFANIVLRPILSRFLIYINLPTNFHAC